MSIQVSTDKDGIFLATIDGVVVYNKAAGIAVTNWSYKTKALEKFLTVDETSGKVEKKV